MFPTLDDVLPLLLLSCLYCHRYAGVLLGLSNTAGVLAGVVGSLATGYILQHGTWQQVSSKD